MSLDDLTISRLLEHPDCPWSPFLRNSTERALAVRSFTKFAALQGVDKDQLTVSMDRYVGSRGGRRQRITDPWSVLPNLARRVVGSEAQHDDVWVLPKAG
jgi:hypothetical protein